MKKLLLCIVLLAVGNTIFSQTIDFEKNSLQPVHVSMSITKLDGKKVVRVTKNDAIKEFDEPTFVKLSNIDFKNGVIEVNVLSKLLPNAPDYSRGFIGMAFRINEDNTRFESIYIRPTNGRATQQLRRNRSIQYFSYPDYKFERLRKEAAGEYESYADMGLNEWIKLKIVVKDSLAKLFLNENIQPSLIVNDLKHGPNTKGAIGLFIDIGTEGFFADLKVVKEN
jgi:hypothetical protein